MKYYKDIRRCPLCGDRVERLGSVYLEFRCQNPECAAIIRFPSTGGMHPEEQIKRFNTRKDEHPEAEAIKEEILELFKDVNAYYNDSSRFDTLKKMLDKLTGGGDD